VLSILTGIVAGAFGSRSLRFPRSWGLVAGAFAGEAMVILVLRHRLLQVGLELAIAALCLIPARRELRRAIAISLAATLVVAVMGASYRSILRSRKHHAATVATSMWP
jgi:hypothetical protein